jgi:hypothetical protein
MEKTVYLGYHEKGSIKWSVFSYLLALVVIGTQAVNAYVQKSPYGTIYAGVFAAALLAGIFLAILNWRNGIPRVVLDTETLQLTLSSGSPVRSIAANEIEYLDFHPARVELVLRAGENRIITLAPQGYDESKRLKTLLKEFAELNGIPLTEALYTHPPKSGQTPH